MKAPEARQRRKRAEMQAAARGDRLEHFLRTGQPRDEVRVELIPKEADLIAAQRDVRALVRRINVSEKGPKRQRLFGRLIVALARLTYVERVMALDELERAGLTPARLVALSVISPEDVRARLAEWQGESRLETG